MYSRLVQKGSFTLKNAHRKCLLLLAEHSLSTVRLYSGLDECYLTSDFKDMKVDFMAQDGSKYCYISLEGNVLHRIHHLLQVSGLVKFSFQV